MALHSAGNTDPRRIEPVGEPAGFHEERRTTRPWQLATGSLACPECDAPVTLASAPAAPTDALACPFCSHGAAVRDFLSLGQPPRAPRVNVLIQPLR